MRQRAKISRSSPEVSRPWGAFLFVVECLKEIKLKYMAKKENKLAIAADIGGTNMRVAIVDEKGKIIAKNVTKTVQKGKSGKVVADQVIGEIKKLIGGDSTKKYKGIGVSIASPIDYKKGGSTNPPNMNFSFVPIIEPLKKTFKLPIYIINDCNAGALGEKYFGSGKKYSHLVYITMSSGIGGGAIVNDNLLLGKDGSAAEVGHMHVDGKYNLPCTCQKGRGHWEAYASGNNIPKFFRAWAQKNHSKYPLLSSAKDIFDAARKRDKIVLKFMEELGKINGRGLSNVIAAYDPEIIVLGGAVALNNSEILLRYAKKYVDKFLRLPIIKTSNLRENAPLLGAAAFVFSEQ
jgi:glucokinase